MLVIENIVSLIDFTILTISDDLGNAFANVFSNVTVAPVDKNAWNRNNYLLVLHLSVNEIALYFGVLCLNFNYFLQDLFVCLHNKLVKGALSDLFISYLSAIY